MLDRCTRLDAFAPPGPLALVEDGAQTSVLTMLSDRRLRTRPLDRGYTQDRLLAQLGAKTKYCPPRDVLRRLLPFDAKQVDSLLSDCNRAIDRRYPPPKAQSSAKPERGAAGYLGQLKRRIPIEEGRLGRLPLRSLAYGQQQALLGRLYQDRARLSPKTQAQDLERAVFAYHAAVMWGPRPERLGWYLRFVGAVVRAEGGDLDAQRSLEAGCDRRLLLDDHPVGRQPAFARVQRCAMGLEDAAKSALTAGDRRRAATLYAAAADAFPVELADQLTPSQRGVMDHQVKRYRAAARAAAP